jgi:MFS family permease
MLIALLAPVTGKLSDRFGSRWFMTGGLSLLAVQLFYFSRLGVSATYWQLLPAMLIGGVGMAATMPTASAAAMRAVPADLAGVGSAVLNSARQVGGSLGIAVIGAIIANEVGGRRTPQAFVDGFSTALVVAALIALAGAVVAATLVRHQMHEEEERRPLAEAA